MAKQKRAPVPPPPPPLPLLADVSSKFKEAVARPRLDALRTMCEQVLASTLFGSTSQPVSLSEDVAEFTEDPLVPFLIHAKENEPLITLTYALLLTQHIKSSDEDNTDESKLTLLTTLAEVLEAAPWSKCPAHMDLDILIKTRIYCCLYAQDNSVDPIQAFTKPNNIPKIPSLVQHRHIRMLAAKAKLVGMMMEPLDTLESEEVVVEKIYEYLGRVFGAVVLKMDPLQPLPLNADGSFEPTGAFKAYLVDKLGDYPQKTQVEVHVPESPVLAPRRATRTRSLLDRSPNAVRLVFNEGENSASQTSAPAAKKSKGASGLAANSKSKKSAARAAETAKLQHSSQSKIRKKRATPEEAEFVQEHEEADDGAGEESDEDEDDEQEKIRKQVELMTQEVIRITSERKTAESANLKASEPRRTVVKTAWTQEEIDALEDGMKTYGAKWSVIGRQKKELKNRNQVQIKDKARNMLMKKIKSGADFGVWALVYTPALQALVEKQIGQKFVLVDGNEPNEQEQVVH
ncbi:hypothetical protein HDU79_005549 [Rhizoclosmatium sp. JEL0117]|nr:hypothetical protein HDU79_005549 [Rhizoclosmatium sp. JEL0117]